MDGIEHRMVNINGITMHVAEKGKSPDVIAALSAAGYRAVAPDLRGYGESDAPISAAAYTCHHTAGDIISLIDSLGVDKVYLVAHDWGALIGWYVCLFRPDKVKAYVSLTVPFRPRHPKLKPVETMRALLERKSGEIEAEIAKYGTAKLPSWLSEDDLKYYTSTFDRKGFTGGLNHYRALDLNWELTATWTGAQVKVPVMFIVGDRDMTYTRPGVKEYVHNGGFKKDVPLLEETVVMEGVGHFINQERAEEISSLIHDFIRRF
ncbi:Soluble epoxide hydrolase [Bertholletia excelsa]